MDSGLTIMLVTSLTHLHMAFLAGGSNRKPWGLTLGAAESSRRQDNGLMMPGPMI